MLIWVSSPGFWLVQHIEVRFSNKLIGSIGACGSGETCQRTLNIGQRDIQAVCQCQIKCRFFCFNGFSLVDIQQKHTAAAKHPNNHIWSWSVAVILFCLIRTLTPRNIVKHRLSVGKLLVLLCLKRMSIFVYISPKFKDLRYNTYYLAHVHFRAWGCSRRSLQGLSVPSLRCIEFNWITKLL